MITSNTRRLPIVLLIAFLSALPAQAQGRRAPNADDGSGLPDLGFEITRGDTALVITDPQRDFLHESGVAWSVVGKNVKANGTVENLEHLMKAAEGAGIPLFVSPHYYYPTDHGWHLEGTLERVMHSIGMFDRKGPLSLEGFEGSGADWLERYDRYIEAEGTVVTSPHKVYGPDTNDLVLQLRKRGISKVVLAGMSANLCTESHLRDLVEEGFEVMVVKDATAAAQVPGYDGYAAAVINFRMIASSMWTTDQTVSALAKVSEAERVRSGREKIGGVDVFYREAGRVGAPKIVLLHGFPTSSHMFRELIPKLAKDFHVLAPDYPGFGHSDAPEPESFEYSFAHLTEIVESLLEKKGFEHFALYVMDYGAPVGFRLFEQSPERVTGFVVQNGNAYEEGLREFWDPIKKFWSSGAQEDRDALRHLLTLEATQWQYQHGTRQPDSIHPDNWLFDQALLDRPGNQEIQLDLFYDYRTNVPRYPAWQGLFRKHQPPTLIVWGKNDQIFPAEGAHPYLRDLPEAELHLLDTGHFALEEDGERIAERMRRFLLGPTSHATKN